MLTTTETTTARLLASPVLTIPEGVYVLAAHGLDVEFSDAGNGAVSVYVNGSHAFDYEEMRPTVRTSLVRSTLNDHSEV